MDARPTLPTRQRERIRRTRLRPKRTRPDYVVLKVLLEELRRVLTGLDAPVGDVLDLFAGTRPYRDLLPEHRSYTSMDIDEHYGPQDMVTDEFLPFADDSFDVVLFTEAFHYVTDPAAAVAELHRVLRPGGTLVLTMPLVWEYDRRIVERRYTGPSLRQTFDERADWSSVEVGEIGGYAAAWATISGRMLSAFGEFGPRWSRSLAKALTPLASLFLNGVAALLARAEVRWKSGPFVLPQGLMLVARREDR